MFRLLYSRQLLVLLLLLLLAGCASTASIPSTAQPEPGLTQSTQPTATLVEASPSPPLESTPTGIAPTVTVDYPDRWQDMPVIPVVTDRARAIYQRGIEMGRDPHSFSVVGDCQNVEAYFLEDFAHPGLYRLGEYQDLQEVIDWFHDSFDRQRAAVRGGYNVASVLSPLWADPDLCEARETPLACEFRLHNPSIVLISMETWWYDRPTSTYAGYMRQIVEYAIGQGVVPILATKADNLEGDHSINAAIVQVAQEYQIPLWNFWLAVEPLPGHGLTDDGFHLRFARPYFNDPGNMEHGWPMRNLTALQALDAVWRGVSEDSD
ncbi:MAG: SGNH/GDSL hydrolase family protein [Anaerolineae bacterium]|nr:SGNH/GDSL hydrolase family protein [Anaerolineae bacterium]